jgi:hypothetical protein
MYYILYTLYKNDETIETYICIQVFFKGKNKNIKRYLSHLTRI